MVATLFFFFCYKLHVVFDPTRRFEDNLRLHVRLQSTGKCSPFDNLSRNKMTEFLTCVMLRMIERLKGTMSSIIKLKNPKTRTVGSEVRILINNGKANLCVCFAHAVWHECKPYQSTAGFCRITTKQ